MATIDLRAMGTAYARAYQHINRRVIICAGTGCIANGALEVYERLKTIATAHELLHTSYRSRKRIADAHIPLVRGTGEQKTTVRVCVGTSCFLRGSQNLLTTLIHRIAEEKLEELVDVSATFCSEHCDRGPTVHVDEEAIYGADVDTVMERLAAQGRVITSA